MTLSNLLKSNRSWSRKLNEENQKYYANLSSHLIGSNSVYMKSAEALSEILDHMILLQDNGRNVKEAFGYDPELFAQEISENLPKNTTIKKLRMAFFVYLFSFSFQILMASVCQFAISIFFGQSFQTNFDLFDLGLPLAIVFLASITLKTLKGKDLKGKRITRGKIDVFLTAFLSFLVLIPATISLIPLSNTFSLSVSVNGWVSVLFGVLGVISCLHWIKKKI